MRSESADRAKSARAIVGLVLTPVVVGTAGVVLRAVHVSAEVASIVVFVGAATTALASLTIAAPFEGTLRGRLALAALAAIVLGVSAIIGGESLVSGAAIDASLVVLAWGVGSSIGRRIEHPGHLLPACVVVACADASSVVSRFGPTHAIAESERALSILAISFPVPGTPSLAPAIGVGDLVFIAIVLGAAVAHRLSIPRAALLAWAGTLVAGALSAMLDAAVPALVPIAAAIVLGIPEARRLRPRDRRAASVAMTIAVAVALATAGSQLARRAPAATTE